MFLKLVCNLLISRVVLSWISLIIVGPNCRIALKSHVAWYNNYAKWGEVLGYLQKSTIFVVLACELCDRALAKHGGAYQ